MYLGIFVVEHKCHVEEGSKGSYYVHIPHHPLAFSPQFKHKTPEKLTIKTLLQ